MPQSNVGTLHSFAYRAIDKPPVVEDHLDEWNTEHPSLAFTSHTAASRGSVDERALEGFSGDTKADEVLAALDQCRARMLPVELWPGTVRRFDAVYGAWKKEHGYVDFSDMLELAMSDVERLPGNPEIFVVDEAQDLTKLELSLIRHWGQHCERLVLGGDDDQAIYSFRGGTPDVMLDPLPDEQKEILSQSYRVPRAVHTVAQRWVKNLSRRQEKEYAPRDADGRVRTVRWSLNSHESLVSDVSTWLGETDGQIDDRGRPLTYMILASCGYMLDPVKRSLRDAGIPFWNPYNRSRGDWNPLTPGRGTSSSQRLLAYLKLAEGDWTGEDVKLWAPAISKRGIFRNGAVERIAALPNRILAYEELVNIFDEKLDLESPLSPDIEWFAQHLLGAVKPGMVFPLQVVRKRGVAGLTSAPRVILGTIHSTKGAEASRVLLCPDLSVRGAKQFGAGGETRDSVIRLFYVGMTRARDELIIANRSVRTALRPRDLLGL
jgi:superfamily I DNA/RNA helicase